MSTGKVTEMLRLCPTLLAVCVLAGCTGQTLDGRWRGGLPYDDAENCRVQLFSNGHFELGCERDAWLGDGRWASSGDELEMRFTRLARSSRIVEAPAPLVLRYEGRGNELRLSDATGASFRWERVLGGR